MTLMTAMTMNCRGSLYGVGHSPEMGDGREHGERKCDKARRCSRLVRSLGDRKRDMLQLQRLAHYAYRVLVQPVQVGLLAQPWRAENAAPGSLPRQHFLHYFSEEIPTGERGHSNCGEHPPTHS